MSKTYPKVVIDDKILNTVDWDKGIIIYHKPSKTYYCGYKHFDKQPRKAKIYHKENYLMEVLETILRDNPDETIADYAICNIYTIVEEGRDLT